MTKFGTNLIIINKVLQFIGVHDYMQAAHLREAELARVDAREAHLLPRASGVCFAGAVHGTC